MRAAAAAAWDVQPLHRHDNARLIVFTAGELVEQCFSRAGRFRPGDCLFRPSWFAHADLTREMGAAYVRLPLSARAVSRWISQHGWRAVRGRVDLTRLPSGDEALSTASEEPYPSTLGSSLLSRAAEMLSQQEPPRVADVAARLAIRPYTLSRHFSAMFGVSPVAYRRQARLQRALGLLFLGADSLAGIASDMGYHDQSHLTADIKRETGRTPAQLAAGRAA
jgi:AraC-like DNA-binding protein